MRFDDALDTVLAADLASPFGKQSAWRQLVDLIGRRRVPPEARALTVLHRIRAEVPPSVRAASARGLEYADPPPALVRLYAREDIAIAIPVLRAARMSTPEWIALLPEMSPAGRAVLRNRRDLSPAVRRALESFGPADFVLGDESARDAEAASVALARGMPARPSEETAEPEAEFVPDTVEAAFFGVPLPEEAPRIEPVEDTEPVEVESESIESAMPSVDWTDVLAQPDAAPVSLAEAVVFHDFPPVDTPTAEVPAGRDVEPLIPVRPVAEEMSVDSIASGHPIAWADAFDHDPAEMFEPIRAKADAMAGVAAEPAPPASGAAEPPFVAEGVAQAPSEDEKEADHAEQGDVEHARMRDMAAPFVALPDYEPALSANRPGSAGDMPREEAEQAAQAAADHSVEEDLSFVALAGFAATVPLAAGAVARAPAVPAGDSGPIQSGTSASGIPDTDIAEPRAPDQPPAMVDEDGAIAAPSSAEAFEAGNGHADVGAGAADEDLDRPVFFEGPDLAPAGEGPFEIADVVARIDAFWRRQQDSTPVDRPRPEPAAGFRFETDAKGVIRWVDGVSRAAVVGVSLELQGLPGSSRVDGVAAGAFRRRAGFTNARLLVEGDSDAAGAWLLSAIPVFDPANGRFTGYRGTARRPRVDERAEPVREAPATPADSLRQLVHELRTPTNAIAGFAEMIESQMLGPVAPPYRDRAGVIRAQARELLGAIDDLDLAARIESAALSLVPGRVPLRPVLAGIADDLAPLAELRGSWIALPVDDLAVTGDRRAVERLLARLMATLVSASVAGERIGVRTAIDADDTVTIAIERPTAFDALTGEAMLAMDDEEGDATLLGTGFALRLVRNLARELGGALVIEPESLTLRLPAAVTRLVEQAHQNG